VTRTPAPSGECVAQPDGRYLRCLTWGDIAWKIQADNVTSYPSTLRRKIGGSAGDAIA
jgi:hypothetical protein